MHVLTTVLALVLAASVVGLGAAKLAGAPAMRQAAAHVGFSFPAYRRIGALEVAGGIGVLVGLAVAPLGILAASCLALLLACAVVVHLRNGDGLTGAAPALVLGALSVAVVVLRSLTA